MDLQWYLNRILPSVILELRPPNLTSPNRCDVPGNMRAVRDHELLFATSKK